MYDYRKFQLDVLTKGLEDFERNNHFNLDDDLMDKVWDVTIKINDNPRIKKFLGRYFYGPQRIEMTAKLFNGNMLAFRDTVLHELAHHFTNIIYPTADGHGPEWKKICLIIGADPKSSKSLTAWAQPWSEVRNTGFYKQYEIKG